MLGSHLARQGNDELGEGVDLTVHAQLSTVLFDHDIVAERQAESGALARRLGGTRFMLTGADPGCGSPAEWPVRRAGKHKTLYVLVRRLLS